MTERHTRTAHLSALLAIVLATLLFVLAGCSSSSSSNSSTSSQSESTDNTETVTFTDDLGRTVTVNKNPQRVVAGMGSFADMWQLAGGTLVGASDDAFDDYGIDSETVASVGQFSSLNQESILELDPDFVILTGNSTGQAGTADQTKLADALEEGGASVAYFKVVTFDDYLRVLRTLCDITGRDDMYEQNGTQVQQRVNDAIEQYSGAASGKKVMVGIVYSQGLRVQRSTTQTGDMLVDLGAVNIADENPSLLSDFSTEALLEIDPDYIFIIPIGTSSSAASSALDDLTNNEAWQSLTAVKEGRCFQLDPDLFIYKPNDQWDVAYSTLGACFTS